MQQINVALCSYGMSGLVFHGPLLEAHPGFKISKILERNRKDSEGKHTGSRIVRDFGSILDDPAIELVVVNTPDHLHYEMTSRVIEAGKHAVVEKPFTLRSEEATGLVGMAREKGVILTVFHNRRWDGGFLTVQKLLNEEKLGRLVEFESHFDRYRLEIKDSWKDRSTGTGTLYNLGSHLVDQALSLFGMPDHLFCDSRWLRDGARTDDSFDLFLHYPDFKCLLRSSYLVREPGPRFILHGTAGSYVKWGDDPQEEALKAGGIPGSEGWGEEDRSNWGLLHADDHGRVIRAPCETQPGNYSAFYDNLYKAIRDGIPLSVRPEEARDVIRIIEAAYASSREQRVIHLQ